MSVFLERTLFYRRYPLPHTAFSAVAVCLRTEYRKLVPLAKTLLEDDFEEESLRDFVEDRNPPLSIRFSVRRDDIQTVMTPEEFETLASEPFSYDQIAVILFLDVDGSMLAFTAGLDGSLRLTLDGCRTLTGEQASDLLRCVSRSIYRLLRPERNAAERHAARDPEEDQSGDDVRKRKIVSLIQKFLVWAAATVIACIIGEMIHENFAAISAWFFQTIA